MPWLHSFGHSETRYATTLRLRHFLAMVAVSTWPESHLIFRASRSECRCGHHCLACRSGYDARSRDVNREIEKQFVLADGTHVERIFLAAFPRRNPCSRLLKRNVVSGQPSHIDPRPPRKSLVSA